ncbi:lysophospholipid acyltransferase family protein [Nocardioides sp. HM23]|uniref:lysophospholipid acyltransferase family protein n=1 Tax=Nocardioides bizhenqiangii TaxID=3095076 RepID=UPI002ACADEE9|nr:lysophospholipid acyltransferase family protein [Nocardioides sp. HM23]MDZ5622689.1 lysophospholipid acyltransferase family protein [Nocardioides sp. HM23]
MGDAEIIPIGTRGRPGRGTGTRPSAAARTLAGKSRAPKSEARPDPPEAEAVRTEESGTQPPVAEQPATEPVIPLLGEDVLPLATDSEALAPRLAVTEREGPGIPVGDLLAAFQVAAREVFGEQWETQLAHFLAFLRRRLTGDYVVDEFGFDPEITERFFLAAVRPIAEKWFRIEVRGAENIPTEGGALIVSNHSGTIPVDALMTMVSVHDHTDRYLRALGADLVFRLPFVGTVARKGGATLACSEDAERMLAAGELVGVWPEGFKGIGKPYSQRYKLQRFGRGGFVSAALRTQVPIIPLSVVGAEEIYPLVGNVPALARLLGVPYIPITPLFPLLGPLGLVPLPSKWLLEFGEPIRTDEYDEGAAEDPMLVFNVTDQVRETIQQTLYSLLMQRESVFR